MLQWFRDDRGATMVEYGLMVSLVALFAFLSVQAFGVSVNSLFTRLNDLIP